ncbi:L-aspartate oxidase [Kribbella sp. VKM Ac-2569]|uniref:L-aspartate oxidase n=1 Tax=Kribbella sp. VKM Ac-2569 TaxID=2512220 RepID=UPI00102AAF60|nr:L-aspartate oxidase [Kribbella sp. VKM Ac-2569]RZT20899.1 L-aspartate oxidase [Kribbella sp. VKM Ac-2569]
MTAPAVPRRLAAPEAGWTDTVDVVVIGSGVAGLSAALKARELGSVLVVTKDVVASGSTQWAQGGVAAALDPEDSPEEHLQDTLVAGAGLSDPEAVRVLVTEGPDAVRDLIDLGARFDTMADGEISLGREGGHHRNRIAHAGGDATGAEIERALVAAVKRAKDIRLIEHALVLDLLTASDGSIAGVTLHVMGEGQLDGVGEIRTRAVILASGGLGQLYAATTNPSVSTGDGMALALRAGAKVRDLEFVQFHPTVLWLGKSAKGQQPLVSEAVRGEGAFLVDHTGKRFMQGQHELADLAPRDIVAKAIMRQMIATGKDHVYLDARHFGDEKWRVRFPTILASCRSHGIDPVRELIPVAPACHYSSGGVWTDLNGQTSVPGLYACGEVACTGVHGANRLASNSLLEGLVFARRIAAHLANGLPERREPVVDRRTPGLVDADVVPELQRAMTVGAGVIRSATGLSEAGAAIGKLIEQPYDEPGTPGWEATNLVTVASALIAAATAREESRGAHWREDHPDRDDLHWFGSLDLTLDQQAVPQATFVPRESEENDRHG